MRIPSTRTLEVAFGACAEEARGILTSTRQMLLDVPALSEYESKCFNPPSTEWLRLVALAQLDGMHGPEVAWSTRGGAIALRQRGGHLRSHGHPVAGALPGSVPR